MLQLPYFWPFWISCELCRGSNQIKTGPRGFSNGHLDILKGPGLLVKKMCELFQAQCGPLLFLVVVGPLGPRVEGEWGVLGLSFGARTRLQRVQQAKWECELAACCLLLV